ncbi:hypothetical protein GO013_16450 [Pseudodesulfovibrio sp. JC047]|uniref:hypothetical protein n=1 Tax=Pseudodesulfovibrio sp. JC047 TaxID=2683199 RepID=UPI0013D78139|nr:hypothetical protein [Pseudodesulfovibrio sp. JC047]NDV21003.1 hypothetical protein [Pseudodesulfovibrio sp. JC047]
MTEHKTPLLEQLETGPWPSFVSSLKTEAGGEIAMSDNEKGLYEKFKVERTDGKSAPGKKHENCDYFVIDMTHDKYAGTALKAYARACRKEYPTLADDLEKFACTVCPYRKQNEGQHGWCHMFEHFHSGCEFGELS